MLYAHLVSLTLSLPGAVRVSALQDGFLQLHAYSSVSEALLQQELSLT